MGFVLKMEMIISLGGQEEEEVELSSFLAVVFGSASSFFRSQTKPEINQSFLFLLPEGERGFGVWIN